MTNYVFAVVLVLLASRIVFLIYKYAGEHQFETESSSDALIYDDEDISRSWTEWRSTFVVFPIFVDGKFIMLKNVQYRKHFKGISQDSCLVKYEYKLN